MESLNYILNIKSKRKIYVIIGAFLVLMVPLILLIFDSSAHLETAQSLCPFKMLTGFPCAGCGITKSMVSFYEGYIQQSLCYHILGPFVILICVLAIVLLTTELITKKEYFNSWFYNKKLGYGLALFLAAYYLIRILFFIKNNSIETIIQQSIWK